MIGAAGMPPGLPPQIAEARTRSLRVAAAVAVIAALGSAAAGWFVRAAANPSVPGTAIAASQPVRVGPVSASVPGAWLPVTRARGFAGLDASPAALFQPTRPLPAYVSVTFGPATDPTLIPASLKPLLPTRLPPPKKAMLGGAHAWRYGEMVTADGRTIELTVAPSDRGVLAVACVASTEAWVAAIGCGEQLHALSLPGATWLRPAHDVAVHAALPGAIARLDARRVTIRNKLRGARYRATQRRLGIRLSAAYIGAADRLTPAAPRTGPATTVITALHGAARANRRMAIAAGHGWPKRYAKARRAVKRNDRFLARSLRQMR